MAGRSDPDAFQYARVAAVQAICALAQDKPDQADVRFAIEVLEQVLRRAPGQSTVSAINNGVALLRTLLKSLQP